MDYVVMEARLNDFLTRLGRKEASLSDGAIKIITDDITKKLSDKQNERSGFTIRMSNVGRPLCQLLMERNQAPRGNVMDAQSSVRFFMGDTLERFLIACLYEAGVNVNAVDIPVRLDIGGIDLMGTADIEIDGGIWDIKSASAKAFYKFRDFETLAAADSFGYIAQGYCYAEGLGKPFRGWIVVNKSSAFVKFCPVPLNDGDIRRAALEQVDKKIRALTNKETVFSKNFTDIPELFRNKETGNRVLSSACELCAYRQQCWPDAQYMPRVFSLSKTPEWVYYTDVKSRPEPNEDVK
jgi:hypothetical protein